MATTVKEKTDRPKGLKIKRDGETFTLSWTIADKDYDAGQWFDYMINDTGKDSWHKKSTQIGDKQKNKSIKVTKDNFYPRKNSNGTFKKKLFDVRMRVKGERKKYTTGSGSKKKTHNPSVSDWSTETFDIAVPKKPVLTAEMDSELTNKCIFSWTTDVKDDTHAWFTDVLYQTMLVKDNSQKDGSKLDWKNATEGSKSANDNVPVTEDTNILYVHNASYTRWFRVKARGPRGDSDWVYANHVYAIPNESYVSLPTSVVMDGGVSVDVSWEAFGSVRNPIDKTTVEYAVVQPEANLKCPVGATWSTADISADTSGKDRAVFMVDDTIGVDQCLYVRVNTQHDTKITYGEPNFVRAGFLADPTAIRVVRDNVTHKATITATNASAVVDSRLVITYIQSDGKEFNVGVIPHGETEIVVQCPNWDNQTYTQFVAKAFVGTATKQTRADGVDDYAITARMVSQGFVADGSGVPVAPQNIAVNRVGDTGTVKVKWDWSWGDANGAQIAWADHDDAWESTDEPDVYTISNMHAAQWNIHDLELGRTWYIRVRLMHGDLNGENVTYGPWSAIDQGTIDLTSTPNKPSLQLSKPIIKQGEKLTANWVYTTNDNMPQANAQVAFVTVEDEQVQSLDDADYVVYDEDTGTSVGYRAVRTYVVPYVAHTQTAQHVDIDTSSLTQGNTYNLAVHVQSQSGRWSEWSDVESFRVANPLVCNVQLSANSFRDVTETVTAVNYETGAETQETITYKALYEMPLEVTVTGAGVGGETTVAVERRSTFVQERPNGDTFTGYEGETVLQKTSTEEGLFSFDLNDRIGMLDDGADYNLVATIQDKFGQQVTSEPIPFTVRWDKQATKPTADIEVDRENLAVKITPHKSAQANVDDVFDIYRLSADKPELIVENGEFGQTYVDPYPTLGEHGGHMVVLKTQNGDYIYDNQTDGRGLAWYITDDDDNDIIELQQSVIDFGGDRVFLDHNVELSSKWEKDFQQTKYMGGSIQGDWTVGVKRSGTINTTMITLTDREDILAMRRLAEYSGICHVRTADGSSYSADVQVSQDTARATYGMLTSFALTVTKVDPQELDGMLLAEWEEMGQDELE